MSEEIIIRRWNNNHSYRDDSLFVNMLKEHGFTNKQVIIVLNAIDSVCHHCWDNNPKCQCWNDD
jgi:hypothetical protein